MISIAIGLTVANYATKLFIDWKAKKKFNQKMDEAISNLENDNIKMALGGIKFGTYHFLSVGDFVPFYNVYLAVQRYNDVDDSVELVLEELEQYYWEEVNKHKKEDSLQVKDELENEYFIGQTIDGRPLNIFFTYDGCKFEIKDYSTKSFIVLEDEDKKDIFFKLLFVWYHGGGVNLNGSNNLDELFDDYLVGCLNDLFQVNIVENYDLKEDILKRIRTK